MARNTQDLLNIVDEILQVGASIQFHKENLLFDGAKKDDPFQKLMLTMLGAISTFERDLMLERQREGIAIAKEKGKYKGRRSNFTNDDISKIKIEFAQTTNKTRLADKYRISRGYLYELIKKSIVDEGPVILCKFWISRSNGPRGLGKGFEYQGVSDH